MKIYGLFLILLCVLFGCSSQHELNNSASKQVVTRATEPVVQSDTLSRSEMAIASLDTSFIADSSYDTVVSQFLEASRQHYLNALDARETGDSIRCVNEFEAAIANLNELASFPGIDSSQDFADLSKSVLQDYEKYIAVIDSLGPQTSIFALREKLNQMTDSTGGADQDKPKKIITTTSIPLVINGHVEEDITFLRTRFKDHFEQWLYRSGIYFPTVKKIFKKEGVPEELAYLAFVESGVNPSAQSWAKAVGMWQFIKGTGALYGLHANFWYDERRDFVKASHAAARHFKDLHNEFGDWYLALAAYNSGAGRVYRAIRKSGSTDFWKMRPFLPKETRNYVPLYIAATVMGMDPKSYGFDANLGEPIEFDEVTVNECVDVSVLAKCAGTDAATIRSMNPAILRWCTPPGASQVTIRVPKGKGDGFDAKYAAIPDDEKHQELFHKVRRKETLAMIARKYGISTTLLAEANRLAPRKRLTAGTILVIPVAGSAKDFGPVLASDGPVKKKVERHAQEVQGRAGKEKLAYRIRKGDTIAEIAKRYGVRVSDLRVWNDIPYGMKIKSGSELTLWIPSDRAAKDVNRTKLSSADITAASSKDGSGNESDAGSAWTKITVKPGDNLKKIAARYHVSIADLKQWNTLNSGKVRAGQKLDILQNDRVDAPQSSTKIAAATAAKRDTSKTALVKSYTVKKGDSLYAIASQFGVSIEHLKQLNKIKGKRLKIGQELRISS